MLEASCFTAEYQLKRLPSLTARHSSLCHVMHRKVNFLNSVSIWTVCSVKVTTSVWSAVSQPQHRPAIVLLPVYCPVDNTLFEISPKIRCSGVPNRYGCYGNHAAGSKQI